MADNSSNSRKRKRKKVVNEEEEEEETAGNNEEEEHSINKILPSRVRGIVKDGKLSKSFEKRLGVNDDAWNLVLREPQFEECVLEFLKNDDIEVRNAVEVRVYDKDGIDYQMMLKKWESNYYVINRGWNTFREENNLVDGDFITMWTFRHALSDILCFFVTCPNKTD